MNVLMLSPGYPDEMVWFTEGLASVGGRVFGVGEAPPGTLPERCLKSLTAYLQVRSLWDEDAVVKAISDEARSKGIQFDRVECLWEPLMILCARLREVLEVPGMSVETTIPFRDKEKMKQVLDSAGIRTPRHYRCVTEDECRHAAAEVGYPLIVKPISGAGSADTYRVADDVELEDALVRTRHVSELSVEEYIEGEEYTFDTVSIGGKPAYFNISWYRPSPLIGRSLQWVSPQTVTLRDVDREDLRPGIELGLSVLKALDFQDGFSHMEWFRTGTGEAVFGEIGCRPPGARTVEIMNIASDIDLYRGWAEAVLHGTFSQETHRRYNSAVIFKRATGEGRIQRVSGLDSLLQHFGPHVVSVNLLPVGARRRNWKATLLSDGHITVRHPDLDTCLEIADRVGTDVQLFAG